MSEKLKRKHEGYQDYIVSENSWLKRAIKNGKRFPSFLNRPYFKLTRIALYNIKTIPTIKQSKRILDIGCGPGESFLYIKNFLNTQAEFYGIDLEKNKNLPDYVKFFNIDIDEDILPFTENYFDIVISTFVLEHLREPQKLFKEANRVLKSGGYFYCTTEYYTSLFLPDYWNFYQDPTHVRPWTKKSLRALAHMCGFEVVKMGHFRPIEFFLLIPFVPILNWIFRLKSSFVIYEAVFGKSLYCILKKP